jgi:hypothetical protein
MSRVNATLLALCAILTACSTRQPPVAAPKRSVRRDAGAAPATAASVTSADEPRPTRPDHVKIEIAADRVLLNGEPASLESLYQTVSTWPAPRGAPEPYELVITTDTPVRLATAVTATMAGAGMVRVRVTGAWFGQYQTNRLDAPRPLDQPRYVAVKLSKDSVQIAWLAADEGADEPKVEREQTYKGSKAVDLAISEIETRRTKERVCGPIAVALDGEGRLFREALSFVRAAREGCAPNEWITAAIAVGSFSDLRKEKNPDLAGALAPARIQAVVRANYGAFHKCYEDGLQRDPKLAGLAGRVAVRFLVDRDGQVWHAAKEPSQTDFPDDKVVDCVVAGYRALSFDPPVGGEVTVVHPIVFSPGQ